MSEATHKFKWIDTTTSNDGLTKMYHLEVTDARSDRTITILVEPRHLVSAHSMKRILLDRCMLYVATKAAHDQMLLEVLEHRPSPS